jgi:maltooligosyltrehalose trehalohydrolase
MNQAPRIEARRRLPLGAELVAPGCASFRVWAPRRERVTLVLEREPRREIALQREPDGYFSTLVPQVEAGALYRFRLDDDPALRPDPASRAQPHGCDGASVLVDPSAYRWCDAGWRGVSLRGQVVYELHVGTFTPEGTWRAAQRELPWLAALGVTLLEVMPVGEFPGAFGWGYDAVHFYAPTRLYGTPDDMRAFVDRAHALGMGVVLDVVYNHCGTIGGFLDAYGPYFSTRHRNDWGNAFNFDGEDAAAVREFVTANAAYWLTEFHLDGFRLDATQSIVDDSPQHIVAELSLRARRAASPRAIVLIGENEPQQAELMRPPAEGGCGLDALWNDDFHHSARVAMTGRREAYYRDYLGKPQELVSAVRWGFLYQGQYYTWQRKARGTPALDLDPCRFVLFLQNHDQVANSRLGLRLDRLTDPGRLRACTALLLLAPGTPMLFQGQEFAASTPFLYFADMPPDAAQAVRDGRRAFVRQFESIAAARDSRLPDPGAQDTFERCKLRLEERGTHAEAVALHRDLLALRRDDVVFRAQRPHGVEGAVLSETAFVLRFRGDGEDRLLIVNLGVALDYAPMPEPLLAPPRRAQWRLLWSSNDERYGGDGAPEPWTDGCWRIPAHVALVLAPRAQPA